MPFVLDASVAVAWVLKEEVKPPFMPILERLHSDVATVPPLWWYEVRNVLLTSERRGRISSADLVQLIADLSSLNLVTDSEPSELAIFDLARRYDLTFYDTAYLEIAVRQRLALATLDTDLIGAATAEFVPLVAGGNEAP